MKEKKEDEQKVLEQSKASKEDKIKKLEQEISTIKSDIEKNKDALINNLANQQFLLDLSDEEFLKKREALRDGKLKELKTRWI